MNADGLGIRSAVKLAPSAFFASAASTLSLQNRILPSRTASVQTSMYVMPVLHEPSLQVYQNHWMKFDTYRKFGIVRSSAAN